MTVTRPQIVHPIYKNNEDFGLTELDAVLIMDQIILAVHQLTDVDEVSAFLVALAGQHFCSTRGMPTPALLLQTVLVGSPKTAA